MEMTKNKLVNCYQLIEEEEKGVELLKDNLNKYKYYTFDKIIGNTKYTIKYIKVVFFQ
jgi:hypothetical protein